MAALTAPPRAGLNLAAPRPTIERRRAVRDSLLVSIGGQLERALGAFTSLALRWGLGPAHLGVYTGLRLYLDNTNRTSLGVGLGAVQEIPLLRAAGRHQEAKHLANVAHTTNALTCVLFSAGLLAWAWLGHLGAGPLAGEWTFGLSAVAALALLKRYETFLVATLRAHQEFALTTELDLVESVASALAVGLGLWLWGFRGLLAAVGVVLAVKIAWAHHRHPLRFEWAWDLPLACRLMLVGLPILANSAAYGALLSLDRLLILARSPEGERTAGLYSVALLGAGWALDLSGRLVLVLYTSLQTTLGRTGDPALAANQALRTGEAQAPVLFAGSAAVYVLGPALLGAVMPRYADGLPALRPLLPGMVSLALAWPARQLLIATGRPFRLCLVTLAGLAFTALTGSIGLDRAGIVGLAQGMTVGFATVFALTTAAAFVPTLGWSAWLGHLGRLGLTFGLFAIAACLTTLAPIAPGPSLLSATARCLILAAWVTPTLWLWARHHQWGGLLAPRPDAS